MLIFKTIEELRAWSRAVHVKQGTVGLVPTMGALHDGHLTLVRAARAGNSAVVASIFVNPTQFGPNEDFAKYPRTFEADCALLEAEGVDAVFAPAPEEMYRAGAATFVEVEGLSNRLDGGSRPGHFRGVATVVAKLFIAAEPDRAYFGQKDAAQVAVLRRMTADLGLPLELIICPIVREPDGLALSSRNRYLSPDERWQALVLSRAVRAVESAYRGGETDAGKLISLARVEFLKEPQVRVDYIALVDWETLLPVEKAEAGSLFAVAAWVGSTRLIDNCVL
ncbi:pantoate--beta-alanine ligase [Acidicapsa dinghuensis]|uniref:Pantothenate synthetase n=1 Tax=Acidicapsa dinghuensis TaxID=2218256 RepID=A0ABW1EEQ0_9BACT|nr:pantoate--beta-alanine ligase [Acidicapsa dinghuensis]